EQRRDPRGPGNPLRRDREQPEHRRRLTPDALPGRVDDEHLVHLVGEERTDELAQADLAILWGGPVAGHGDVRPLQLEPLVAESGPARGCRDVRTPPQLSDGAPPQLSDGALVDRCPCRLGGGSLRFFHARLRRRRRGGLGLPRALPLRWFPWGRAGLPEVALE